MLQRATGFLALIGGALLAGSLLSLAASGIDDRSATSASEPTAPPRNLMEALDRDRDGALSPEEISLAAMSIQNLDVDRNGTVTAVELARYLDPAPLNAAGVKPGATAPAHMQPSDSRNEKTVQGAG
jgi:hypothetical protein